MNLRERMQLLVDELESLASGIDEPLRFMEVCGTHTVNACRSGVHALMPPNVRLLSGPGCPVCVTAQRYIDALVDLGGRDDVTVATYGDMMRVAGEGGSLEIARSQGADVRVITSTMDAVELARMHPDRQVVLAAVGFETTAPATAAAVLAAERLGLANFTVLAAHKLVMPALRALLEMPGIRVDGFLCPGHVSVIIGARVYDEIVRDYGRPCVIAGFEGLQIMEGVLALVRQVSAMRSGRRPRNENCYGRVVSSEGNPRALELINHVFITGDAAWRALGVIPDSGLELRAQFARFDALKRFDICLGEDHDAHGCRCGEVITGRCEPADCPLFGTVCTPIFPVGPCMVSSEGSCQAWFRYRRHEQRMQRPPQPRAAGALA